MDVHVRRLLIAVGGLLVLLALVSVVIALVSGGGSSTAWIGPPPNESGELPRWIEQEHLRQAAVPGAKLFAVGGCTVCHTYAGSGSTTLNAPDLTSIGSRHLGIGFQVRHLDCPSCANPGSPMPPYASLGARRVHQLAVFLEDSKGAR
jgi:mono/diheme cytochrome c family protein